MARFNSCRVNVPVNITLGIEALLDLVSEEISKVADTVDELEIEDFDAIFRTTVEGSYSSTYYPATLECPEEFDETFDYEVPSKKKLAEAVRNAVVRWLEEGGPEKAVAEPEVFEDEAEFEEYEPDPDQAYEERRDEGAA